MFVLKIISNFISNKYNAAPESVLLFAILQIDIMKKLFFLTITCVILSFAGFAQTGSELDNENGTSMMPIINSLTDVVTAMEESDVEIVHIEFDLVFNDSPKEVFRYLSQDYAYGFLAYGDYRIAKIGLDLYKETETGWEFIQTGELTEGTTTLMHTVTEAGYYKLVISAPEMYEGYSVGHYGLVVIHD